MVVKEEINQEDFEKLDEKEINEFLKAKRFLEKSKHFKSVTNYNNNENISYDYLQNYVFLNDDNVVGIMYKDYIGYQLLIDFYNKDLSNPEVPTLNYDGYNVKGTYSCEYVLFALSLCSKLSENVEISTNKDYPITIENKHIKIIIAPKGEK